MVDYLIKIQTGNGKVEEVLVELAKEPAKHTAVCYTKLYTERK